MEKLSFFSKARASRVLLSCSLNAHHVAPKIHASLKDCFWLFVIIFLSACHKDNQTPIIPPLSAFTTLDVAVKSKMEHYNIPGLSLAIIKDDQLIYAKSYGFADKEASQATSNNSLYRVGSVSKIITAIAILKLVQEGKLNTSQTVFGAKGILGDDFGTPPIGSNKELITVQNLLDHKSGWTNSPDDPTFNNLSWTQTQMIKDMVENRPLTSQPNSAYYYLNFGYVVLGRVIEKISGTNYENYVKTNLLVPAGISGMRIGGNTFNERYPNEVKYYAQPVNVTTDFPYLFDVSRADAAYGWIASSTDLAKFMMTIDRNAGVADVINASLLNQELIFGLDSWIFNGSIPSCNATICRLDDHYCFSILTNTRTEISNDNDAIFGNFLNVTLQNQIHLIPSWPGSYVSNPLAGEYQWKYRRWNLTDTTTTADQTLSDSVTWAAVSETELQFWGGYTESLGINAPYRLSFVKNESALSNFEVKIDPSLEGGLTADSFTLVQDPAILKMTISPTHRYFKIWYKVKNPNGALRTLIDEYWMP